MTSMTSGVELEILRHKLAGLTAEMAATLTNAAQAPTINEERDFAVGIVDTRGNVVAIDNPLRLGSFERSAATITRYFKFDMTDGDVVLLSDPHRGTQKVQDWTVLTPYIVDSTIVLHLMAVGHIRDVGGMLAGSYYPQSEDVWGEGVPISPVKVRKSDRPVRDIVKTVLLNSRLEGEASRDLDTMIASVHLGRDRLGELIGTYGLTAVRAAADYAQDYTERRVRAAIAQWPDGSASATAQLSHNGAAAETVTVRATCDIAGDQMTIDLSDSDPQQPGFVNSTLGNTVGLALVPVLCNLSADIGVNSGLSRAVRIVAEPGTVVNANPPVAVGWSQFHCGAQIVDAVTSALAGVLGFTIASAAGSRSLALLAPRPLAMERVDAGRFAMGRGGATGGCDGWGTAATLARAVLPSVEQWNSVTDMTIHSLEFVPDSGGLGQWRGALAVEALIEVPEGRDVTLFAPSAVMGTLATGTGAEAELYQPGRHAPAQRAGTDPSTPTRLIRLRSAAGAGFGDPSQRERSAVNDDVLDGLVSAAATQFVHEPSQPNPSVPVPTTSAAQQRNTDGH
jgi:N-methylhydantoinase B